MISNETYVKTMRRSLKEPVYSAYKAIVDKKNRKVRGKQISALSGCKLF